MVHISIRSDDVTTTSMVGSPNLCLFCLYIYVVEQQCCSSACFFHLFALLAPHVKHEDWNKCWNILLLLYIII
jgi:hypothetical protein